MNCKVCNKKISFCQLSIDKMCISCYRKVKNAQRVEKTKIPKIESQQEEKQHENYEHSRNLYSVSANLLKVLGLILSALSLVAVIVLGSGIFQILKNASLITSDALNSYYIVLMAILGIISLLPGVVIYGFGKVVETAHIYIQNNRA